MLLIERRRERAEFLARERNALQLPQVSVFAGDAAALAPSTGFVPFDRVLAKAVARPQYVLALAKPLLRDGGELLLFGRPNMAAIQEFELGDWAHHELALLPEPAGPTFAPSALHCFRRSGS